jgi:hypothetical protein
MVYDTLKRIANPIRVAVWNWIDLHPAEFNECIRHRRQLDGAPERVFDALWRKIEPGSESDLWPTLAVLACISSDRLIRSDKVGRGVYTSGKFGDEITKNLSQDNRLSSLALECALDICRAATHLELDSGHDIPLQSLAFDLAHDIKVLQRLPRTRLQTNQLF